MNYVCKQVSSSNQTMQIILMEFFLEHIYAPLIKNTVTCDMSTITFLIFLKYNHFSKTMLLQTERQVLGFFFLPKNYISK